MEELIFKQPINIIPIGTPSIAAMSDSEQTTFYAALLKRISELASKGENDK